MSRDVSASVTVFTHHAHSDTVSDSRTMFATTRQGIVDSVVTDIKRRRERRSAAHISRHDYWYTATIVGHGWDAELKEVDGQLVLSVTETTED